MTFAQTAAFFHSRHRSRSPAEHHVRRTRDRLARFAWLLDSAFRVPGTNVRVGLEPLLGFVPGIGDLVGKALSLYLVYEAWRLGVPGPLLVRMIGNVAVDAAIGVVPVAGDLGDVFWRANRRNIALLDRHLAERGPWKDSRNGPVIDGDWRRLD